MSMDIPKFESGDRCQVMQTAGNVSRGIASICGVVVDVDNVDAYRVFLENGVFVQIDGSGMNHVSEETYHNWKKNKVKTWEAWTPK